MAYVLSVDVGTSFTAAAIARLRGGDREPLQPPQAINLGSHAAAVPSVIYVGEDGTVLVGEAAERRGTSCPDQVVREFKRRIGDSVPIMVGDLSVTPEDIFATVVRWVVDRAQEREGEAPDSIVVSHPASWGDYKTGLIRGALASVGLADVTLLSEPEAAALHYASQTRVADGSLIAVYDFGGGTFDAAVLHKDGMSSFSLLGKPEGLERVGGADVDDLVFAHVAAGLDGGLEGIDPASPDARVALDRVRRECVEAKEALSADSEATIPVLLPGLQTAIRLVRSEFEGMLDPLVRDTIGALRHAIDAAEVDAEQLSAVLLTGGSSRIPLVAQLLSTELGRPIAIDADPKASISLGAAYFAARNRTALISGQTSETDSSADEAGHIPPGFHAAHTAAADNSDRKPVLAMRAAAVTVAVATITALTATAAQSPHEFSLFGSMQGIAQGSTAERNGYIPGGDPQEAEAGEPSNSVMAAKPTPPGMSPVVDWEPSTTKATDKASPATEESSDSDGAGTDQQDKPGRTSTTAPKGGPSTSSGNTSTDGAGAAPGSGTGNDTNTAGPGTGEEPKPNQTPPAPPATQTPAPEPPVDTTPEPEPTHEPVPEPEPTQDPVPTVEPPATHSPVPEPPVETTPASEPPAEPAPQPTATVTADPPPAETIAPVETPSPSLGPTDTADPVPA